MNSPLMGALSLEAAPSCGGAWGAPQPQPGVQRWAGDLLRLTGTSLGVFDGQVAPSQ